jgi:hypothetical protein
MLSNSRGCTWPGSYLRSFGMTCIGVRFRSPHCICPVGGKQGWRVRSFCANMKSKGAVIQGLLTRGGFCNGEQEDLCQHLLTSAREEGDATKLAVADTGTGKERDCRLVGEYRKHRLSRARSRTPRTFHMCKRYPQPSGCYPSAARPRARRDFHQHSIRHQPAEVLVDLFRKQSSSDQKPQFHVDAQCLESTEFSGGKTARNGPKNDVSVIWLFYQTLVERSGASQNGQDPRKSPKNHSMAMQELGTLKSMRIPWDWRWR